MDNSSTEMPAARAALSLCLAQVLSGERRLSSELENADWFEDLLRGPFATDLALPCRVVLTLPRVALRRSLL